MGWLDQVPRAGKLYIGGLHALYQRPDLFREAGITHIVSVLDFDIYEAGHFAEYTHLHLRLDDNPNEDLLAHFARATTFIGDALDGGGGVFVHCAMGKSRSAAVVCAFLMRRDRVSPDEALAQVCEGRPVCAPNPGFMEQLDVYYDMLRASSEDESRRIYDEWRRVRYQGSWWSWDKRYRKARL